MYLNNWKIFDKKGSPVNWSSEIYLPLTFSADSSASGASGYLITDPSGYVVDAKITNSGFYYTEGNTSVSYKYLFEGIQYDISDDVSINYIDVSIFNPNPVNTQGILSLSNIDVSSDPLVYPSTIYSSALFLDPVSQGLIETEHLYIFEEPSSGYFMRPYDSSFGTLIFQMYGGDAEISFFVVDENSQEVTWTDILEYELDVYGAEGSPLMINIGFRSEDEGIYERRMRIFNKISNNYYLMGEILINAESIGEDERFRTLLDNFGLPDPIDFPKMFKETDINEDLPDYKIVNPKSKYMILEHANIIPYVGTYKALINSLKWLGYDDIFIREWFKDVTNNTKKSFIVPFDAKDRTQTILQIPMEDRKTFKKLNQLSLNYCLTRETGEIDDWGTPITENCYTYNIKEIFVKLLSLKDWLEKNIIGVNARIIDLTGEGVYFERYINLTYATDNIGYDYHTRQSLTPLTFSKISNLSQGESSINMSFLELTNLKIEDLPYKFSDFIDYVWDPFNFDGSGNHITLSATDPSYLANPSSYVEIGAPIRFPMPEIDDIQWKASVRKDYSGALQITHVTNPLWVYNNQLKFYNIFDTSAIFYDSSINLDIVLEKAYIRDAAHHNWPEASAYSIYPYKYIGMNSSTNKMFTRDGSYAIISGSGTITDASHSYTYNISSNIFLDPSYFYVRGLDASIYIKADTSTVIETPYNTKWVMESSLGVKYNFEDYVNFSVDTNSLLQYAYDASYGVPLLGMKNFKTIDASESTITLDTDKLYYLNIIDGKISMKTIDSSLRDDQIYYINFWEDEESKKQFIELNVEYYSQRMPLYVIDPSEYYAADPSGLSGGGADSSILLVDNSIYTMTVNHTGRYIIESFGWDGYNTMFYNRLKDPYRVYLECPTLYALLDNSINAVGVTEASTYMSYHQIQRLRAANPYPIFERIDKFVGLQHQLGYNNYPYINSPYITYFHELPKDRSITKYYNLTEKILNISGTDVSISDPYQNFTSGDNIKLVYFDKGSYHFTNEVSSYVSSGTANALTLDNIPSSFVLDSSHDIYLLNDTERLTQNASNYIDSSTFSTDVSGYTFQVGQLVSLIITDVCTGYRSGSSFRVNSVDGSTHTFNNLLPSYVVDNTPRYSITAKHGFSTAINYLTDVSVAYDSNDNFELWYDRSEYFPYMVDNTFVMINPDFDYDAVRENWYDTSLGLINNSFYYFKNDIIIDASTLVIFRSKYDDDNYMLGQRNIWTVYNRDTSTLIFKVYNNDIFTLLDPSIDYDISVETYDYYGNLIKTS